MLRPEEAGLAVEAVRVCIDANDVPTLVAFWAGLFGYEVRVETVPGDDWAHLEPTLPGLPPLTIQPVPEGKAGKNRLHLDVFVADTDAWLARCAEFGAVPLWRSEAPDDWFQVLADPEGNEFCICRHPTGPAPAAP